jgi:hypothetical protein
MSYFCVLIMHVMVRTLALLMGRKGSQRNLKISSRGTSLYQSVPPIYVQQYKEWFLHICWLHDKRFIKLLLLYAIK